ncbi:zinc-binding dehydrogenase [Actinopolymorpha rutila]|uniref:NADPH-dependent curcumin reductase CurA/DNA-binding transcriptional MerR regulator n=1 Tax=Actinopolymorpha rutila TaxID=446787 RepID=A0A852ZGH2_9ACTN|nr:NADPH-dependent curcumin reductase CurA/DNA-binding transcriptional MerR regulator [Actinopolymorpha rutila]
MTSPSQPTPTSTSTPPRTSREVRLVSVPDTLPRPENLAVVETPVPEPAAGEVLLRNRFFHVFPALRSVMGDGVQDAPLPPLRPGDTLFGAAIGEVVSAPAGSTLRPGDLVSHWHGWREYAVVPASECVPLGDGLPDPAAHLSQGSTAYDALTDGADVRPGDTVFVSGAAGSLGSMAGQLARLLGAGRVVGSTSTRAKADRLVAELGYDAVLLRGRDDDPIADQLAKAAPDGIDVFFDNVGGEQLRAAVAAARPGARFVLVGALSGQLSPVRPSPHAPVEIDSFAVILKRLRIRGFSGAGLRAVGTGGMDRTVRRVAAGRGHHLPPRSDPGHRKRSAGVVRRGSRQAPGHCDRGVVGAADAQDLDGGAMRIGDAAAAAGTTARALRFYEQRGLLPAPTRTMAGYREYTSRDVSRVRLVRELLALGLTVEDVRGCADWLDECAADGLPKRCAATAATSERAGIAERRLAALDAEIARLTETRDRLAARMNTSAPVG